MKKSLLLGIGGVLLFTGCCKKLEWVDCGSSCNNSKTDQFINKPVIKTVKYGNKTCVIDNRNNMQCILKLEAKGVGVAPCDGTCNAAQARVMARRAAVLDAYRALIEKIYGIQINGRDSVKNMALQSSVLRSHIEGIVRGANIEDESFKNGVYSVTMSLKLNVALWNQYLANNYYPYNTNYIN